MPNQHCYYFRIVRTELKGIISCFPTHIWVLFNYIMRTDHKFLIVSRKISNCTKPKLLIPLAMNKTNSSFIPGGENMNIKLEKYSIIIMHM
jgi:hypothetical protein